ncbi:MAG: hypothetical protein ACRD9L_23660 [Bryobacteraceae bacterium]
MEKIQFQTNVPQTIALKYANGKRIESRYNEYEVYYSVIDSPPLIASPVLADKIAAFEPEPGVPFSVCKREIKDGNKKRIEWQVLPVKQPEQQVVRPAAPIETAQRTLPNGSISSQNNPPGIPARTTLTDLFGGALVAAIDALSAAREYGKSKGFDLDWNEEDVRCAGTTIFINYFDQMKEKAKQAYFAKQEAAQSGRVNGGTTWQQ